MFIFLSDSEVLPFASGMTLIRGMIYTWLIPLSRNAGNSSLFSGPAQDIRRRGVGWEKGLERKLRQGDINRRPENRRRTDERENALLRREPERDCHAGVFSGAAVLSALAGSSITTEFV